jgi:hypothetical protein
MQSQLVSASPLPKNGGRHRHSTLQFLLPLPLRFVGVPGRATTRLASLPGHACQGIYNNAQRMQRDESEQGREGNRATRELPTDGEAKTRANQLCPGAQK